jgi:hypothetical protein
MFRLEDGRSQFYQWDLNRRLIIADNDITQVHFCNRTDECSLVCDAYTENGIRLVDVPNVLLQSNWRINVYAFDKEYTKHNAVFTVVARTKPADYVYTETEVHTWNELDAKITEVQEGIPDAVEDYLEQNPVEVDLSNYYDKAAVDAKIETIELTPGPKGEDGKDYVLTDTDKTEIAGMVDVSGADVEIDEKTIKKTSDGKLRTALEFRFTEDQYSPYCGAWGGNSSKAHTSAAFAFGHYAEANSYASAAFNVGKANGNKAFATGYFTNAYGENSAVFGESTNAQGTDQVVMGKYNLTDKTSALIIGNGDSTTKSNALTVGFDGNVWAAGEITVGADKKKLITADDVPPPDLTGYATETYVDDAINQALVGDGADLSDYYTKDEVAALGYQTQEQIAALGYQTQEQIAALGYQTAAQVEAAITTALGNIGVAEEGAY